MEVIAFISRKGGGGKTTSALCIADQLRRRGKSVLIIDLDAKRNASKAMAADLVKPNVTNLLDGTSLAEVVQHTESGDIVPGSIYLNAADAILTNNYELKKALERNADQYDYVLIDCPDQPGRLTANAITAANSLLITFKAEPFHYDGIDDLAATIEQAKETNSNLVVRGILVTAYDGRSNIAKKKLDDFRAKAADIGTHVIEPPIRATSKVWEAQDARVNLSQYAPRSTAAEDYKSIVDELLK